MSCFQRLQSLPKFKPVLKTTTVPKCCSAEVFSSLSPDQSCNFLSTLSWLRSYPAAEYNINNGLQIHITETNHFTVRTLVKFCSEKI